MSLAYKIDTPQTVHLSEIEPRYRGEISEEEGRKKTAALGEEMGELFDLIYAAGRKSMLIVLQGRDTSGKDGLIRHLLTYVNVQSCHVVPFKVPTEEELSHDFLWRVHAKTPALGNISVFNRSHYEDVLAVRVHNLAPEEKWRRRYDQINAFESTLIDADTIILKFFLHISKEEQEERLLKRQQDPRKFWKLSVGDWKERELWDRYTEAFEEAVSRCSSPEAPWYILPADRKWFRNLAVTEAIVETLRPYREPWMDHLKSIGEVAKKEIEAYRSQGK